MRQNFTTSDGHLIESSDYLNITFAELKDYRKVSVGKNLKAAKVTELYFPFDMSLVVVLTDKLKKH